MEPVSYTHLDVYKRQIQTYVFDVGLSQGRYAYATAVGLIQSVISLILIFASNFVSKKLTNQGLF